MASACEHEKATRRLIELRRRAPVSVACPLRPLQARISKVAVQSNLSSARRLHSAVLITHLRVGDLCTFVRHKDCTSPLPCSNLIMSTVCCCSNLGTTVEAWDMASNQMIALSDGVNGHTASTCSSRNDGRSSRCAV